MLNEAFNGSDSLSITVSEYLVIFLSTKLKSLKGIRCKIFLMNQSKKAIITTTTSKMLL